MTDVIDVMEKAGVTDVHASGLRCAYLPLRQYAQHAAQSSGMLGTICFSALAASPGAAASNMPFAQVPMPALDAQGMHDAVCESWRADGAITYGQRDGVRYGHNDEIVFGVIQLSEAAFDADNVSDAGKTPLQQAAESAYRSIFSAVEALRFPHILRFWNYIADINGDTHGLERYRQFNMGRQDGFLHSGRTVMENVPAASAVGCAAGPLTVCFLAGRSAPAAIENPRQVSAYRYPQDYGPRSPTFSRAAVARIGGGDVFFLSGTASIVGHKTLHAGDAVAQTRETMANIAAVLEEAARVAPAAQFAPASLCYKVYVRDEKDVAAIHAELRRTLGASARLTFVKADICRKDLSMEIEATAGHPSAFPTSSL